MKCWGECCGEWSSLLTVTERVTETSAENGHSELFINNSDRSVKLTSHFVCFFFPLHQLWSRSFCLNSWHRCWKRSHVQTLGHNSPSRYASLPSEIMHTHVPKPDMAPLSTCHRLACTPPIQVPFFFFFLIGRSSPRGGSCVLQQTQ